MKKLLLLIAFAGTMTFSGCNSDNEDDTTSTAIINTLSTNVNGVEVNYDVISTTTESYTVDGEDFTDLIVTASKSGTPSESITFKSNYLQSGTDSLIYFEINNGDLEYDTANENTFTMTISESTANKVKGIFSGTVKNWDLSESAVLTNGTFDIKF